MTDTVEISLETIKNKSKGWFPLDDVVVDVIQRNLKPREFSVFIFMLRKTVGWNKQEDQISMSQIEEFTGLSKNTAREAVKGLISSGLISISKQPTKIKATTYKINSGKIEFPKPENRGSKSEPLSNLGGSKSDSHDMFRGSKSEPDEGQNLTPQYTLPIHSRESKHNASYEADCLVIRENAKPRFNPDDKFLRKYKKAVSSFGQENVSLAILGYAKNKWNKDKNRWNFEKLLNSADMIADFSDRVNPGKNFPSVDKIKSNPRAAADFISRNFKYDVIKKNLPEVFTEWSRHGLFEPMFSEIMEKHYGL